jgi:hypothetical protein
MKSDQELLGQANALILAILANCENPPSPTLEGRALAIDWWDAVRAMAHLRPPHAIEAVTVCVEADRANRGVRGHLLAEAIRDLERVTPASPESVGAVVGEAFDAIAGYGPYLVKRAKDAQAWRAYAENRGRVCDLANAAADLIETPTARNLATVRAMIKDVKHEK